MKRIITAGLAILFLLLVGCVEDNPFKANPDTVWEGGLTHPHITESGTSSLGFWVYRLNDLNPDIEGIQDGILLLFDEDMDPETIIASSFNLIPTDPEGGTIQFSSIEYNPEEKIVELRGTFSEETAYLLTVVAGGPRNLSGKELDPNYNALYDGSPWDDQLITFFTGTAQMRDITSPVINAHYPAGGGQSDLRPEFTVIFQQGPMDESQLNLENFTVVRTSDSNPVDLELTSATGSEIVATPVNDLEYGVRYTVRLSSQITDSSGNYLDTDNNGYIWPDEEDFVWDIQIEDDSNTHSMPPTVSWMFYMNHTVQIVFEQSLTSDYVVMDETTFTSANIQVTDDIGAIPLRFSAGIEPDEVFCLLQRNPVGTITVHVSCYVADQYGNLLDGNNDGLGGTPGEDDWTGVI